MVFAGLLLISQETAKELNPDRATARLQNTTSGLTPWSRMEFEPRIAPAPKKTYPMMAKHMPCFATYGLRKLTRESDEFCKRPPVDSAPSTNATADTLAKIGCHA